MLLLQRESAGLGREFGSCRRSETPPDRAPEHVHHRLATQASPLYSTVLLAALTTLLAVAVRWDSIYNRIPNWASGLGLATGCLIGAADGGLPGLGWSLAGAAVGLLCLIPFYVRRGMGAGDVKLMSAVGSFLGPTPTVFAAALTLIAGGVMGVITLIRLRSRSRLERSRLEALIPDGTAAAGPERAVSHLQARFPYAIAIAVGTALSILLRGLGLMPEFNP